MKKTYYAITVACLLLSSCRVEGEKATNEITFRSDTVIVDALSAILSEIKVESLHKELFHSEFRTVGTVGAPMGHYAEVGVPFDGRIMSSKVMPGSMVRRGQTLFEVSSPEFFDAAKVYFQNLRRLQTSQSSYERKKTLHQEGVVSLRELEEALTQVEDARQEKAASEAAFKAYGMNPSTMEPGQPMRIVAPISGEVVRCNITPGTYVHSDDDALLAIADLGSVWVTAQVKERFIGSVSKGGRAEIFTEAEPQIPIWGKVLNVGNLVDPQTRSVQVIVECDNPILKLKHGMFVSVHFVSEPVESVVVSATAVFQGGNANYVYVAADGADNKFIPRQVVTGEPNDDNTRIQILDGLHPGDRIVTDGGLFLNN